jgi:hypothetical protein
MNDLLNDLLNITGQKRTPTADSNPAGGASGGSGYPSAAHGKHQITESNIMKGYGGPSPMNVPEMTTVRSFPIETTPEYKTRAQADAMVQTAKEKREGARQSIRYYRALSQTEESDAVVHVAHRAYLGVAAKSELVKKRADVKLARLLHAQRPAYAALSASLDLSDKMASSRINQVTQIQSAQLSAFQQQLAASTQQRLTMLNGGQPGQLAQGLPPTQTLDPSGYYDAEGNWVIRPVVDRPLETVKA